MQRYSLISLLLSAIGIVTAAWINYEIACAYNEVTDGKTRALFGLVVVLRFGYKYYFSLMGFLALGIAIVSLVKKESVKASMLAIGAAVLCISLLLFEAWRVWI